MSDYYDLDCNNLDGLIKTFPEGDFASEKYDNINELKSSPEKLLIILSTQRSGSTYLCDLLRQANICNPHEYFQPYQYIQYLAHRWECIEGDKVNINKYIKNLELYRTNSNGVLGINLHGSHLKIFEAFKQKFTNIDNLEIEYIFLRRENEISQAVSYELASQTKQWSSHFTSSLIPTYDFAAILKKLKKIQEQNNLITAYLVRAKIHYTTLTYETLISADTLALKKLGLTLNKINEFKTIKKQSSSINGDWLVRFSNDLYNQATNSDVEHKKDSIKNKIKSVFKNTKIKSQKI